MGVCACVCACMRVCIQQIGTGDVVFWLYISVYVCAEADIRLLVILCLMQKTKEFYLVAKNSGSGMCIICPLLIPV